MNQQDNAFLRDFFRQVTDTPLSPDDKRYISLYEDHSLAGVDPVEALARGVLWTPGQSVQLLSGFRGTGKSTELRRLKKLLEDEHNIVLLCDMEEHLNLSTPVDVSDFLLALAGAFSDSVVEQDLLDSPLQRSWNDRLTGLFDRIDISDLKFQLSPITLKVDLKEDPSFKSTLQKRMSGHIGALVNELRSYFEDCTKKIKQRRTIEPEVVLLVDSVEHIRGTSVNAQEVQSSVETLFASHAEKLHLPGLHVVYTVPPYLKVRYGNLGALYAPGGVQMLPAFKLRKRDGRRLQRNYDAMARLVAARGDWKRLLGDRALLDRLIGYSGGHLRDLLNLVAGVLRLAERLPVDENMVDAAIHQMRNEFLPIAGDDAKWLAEIAGSHQTALSSAKELPTLARFLDTHLALCYRNGEEWYDIHPLIADEVNRQAGEVQAGSKIDG